MQHPTHTPTRAATPARSRRGIFRAWQTAAAFVLVALGGAAASTSSSGCGSATTCTSDCGGSGTGGGGIFCEGGFIRPDPGGGAVGTCEGKCTAEACGAGQACVDNHCALTCASHLDCTSFSQDCAPAKDDDGKDITTCQGNGKGSIGVKCPFGTECGTAFACPDGKICDPACTGPDCPCPADKCAALSCLTAGQGDAEAYCTQDCHGDAECPGGFWCATVRDSHKICGTTTGGPLCGTSTDPCVDPAQNMATGATYSEGTLCAFRDQCRIRKQCAPCETDLDCSVIPGQHCTTMALDGTKACTRDCIADGDCEVGFKCAEGACISRFGSCVGTGKYCEPCRNDKECGAGLACLSYGGAERFCIAVNTTCALDADCPTGPDGRHGICANAAFGLTSSDIRFNKCFFPPQNDASGRLSCWCANPGTACNVSKDCCSGKCSFGECK